MIFILVFGDSSSGVFGVISGVRVSISQPCSAI